MFPSRTSKAKFSAPSNATTQEKSKNRGPKDASYRHVSEDSYEDEANRVATHILAGRSLDGDEPPHRSPIDEPVPSPVLQTIEPLLGRDFSSVRLRSADFASPETFAMTRGNTISFAPGKYQPKAPAGQALIAHELTHVAQQRAAPPLPGRGTATFSNEIDSFREEHPHDRLESARESLIDRTGRYPTSLAPLGMQQHCAGCNDCSGGSKDENKDKSKDPSKSDSKDDASVSAAPSSSTATPGPSPGTTARATAKGAIDAQDNVKAARDKLKASLNEIRAGKALEFHKTKTKETVKKGAQALGIAEADLISDWDWFLDKGPPGNDQADEKTWSARTKAFLGKIQTPLDKLDAQHPKSQAANFVKNTPANVYDAIIQASTAGIPPAFLYAVAGNEGLVNVYIRGQVPGAAASDRLSESEMAGVRVDQQVQGFQALGLDDYFTDASQKRQPLSGFAPPGFDQSKLTESDNQNEKGRTVRSANAPDLKTGLQALVAVIGRRKAMFQEDRTALGYPDPTADQIVYFSYVYYNSGPGDPAKGDGTAADNGGYQTLSRHRPGHPNASEHRNLNDWIAKGEYPNAQKVLQTYQVIVGSGVLKGF